MAFVRTTDGYKKLEKFIASDVNLNLFVHGPKGCGKTKTIMDIHEKHGKNLVRVNISIETDEDALIGGFRLKNGETFFDKGPVIKAMEEGATLLLDEIDLGHPQKLMCLQSILEFSGYHIKKTNERILPAPGFKILATANTKGIGDETGSYVGTQFLNAAMRDRFSIFIQFDYPSKEAEMQILMEERKVLPFKWGSAPDDKVLNRLVSWASLVRKSENNLEETVSTRKLLDILKCMVIEKDLSEAIRLGISGMAAEHIEGFMQTLESINDDGEEVVLNKEPEQVIHKF